MRDSKRTRRALKMQRSDLSFESVVVGRPTNHFSGPAARAARPRPLSASVIRTEVAARHDLHSSALPRV